MNLNFTKMLFLMILIFSTFFSISSSNWFSMWMGLELNLFSIIPIFNFKSSIYSIESTMKYFLIQAFTSIILLIFLINKSMFFFWNNNILIILPLLMKMSLMPFHLWLPSMIEGLNWFSCLLMFTWQKITPMIMISYLNFNKILILMFTLLLINSIYGFNQNSLRKILAMSSINNSSWMMMALLMNEKLWINYFLIYLILNSMIIFIFNQYNMNYINQLKFFNMNYFFKLNMLMLIFSIMGLPPMLGFLMKWMLIKNLMLNNLILIMIILMMMSIFNLFLYLKMTYFILFNFNISNKWFYQNKNYFKKNIFMFINFCSILINYIIIY
uniref:NADH-ubiquinone oxidoreductase chain 2 n=1 Tax=Paracolopha morrisoni TaxID=1308599 RepID=A0A5J6KND5_9HEMI|nr:NADH dehydrogenase subunit 2 [Paracolopha morrisoni]QEV85458.1 NADH dehydrogenase subunit 2 [Paracolopha morrisoni]